MSRKEFNEWVRRTNEEARRYDPPIVGQFCDSTEEMCRMLRGVQVTARRANRTVFVASPDPASGLGPRVLSSIDQEFKEPLSARPEVAKRLHEKLTRELEDYRTASKQVENEWRELLDWVNPSKSLQ